MKQKLGDKTALLTPAQAKKLAIELLARAMTGDIVKLAKANYRCIYGNNKPVRHEKKAARESAVDAAMDAYEPHRILLDEIGARVIERLFKLADIELNRITG